MRNKLTAHERQRRISEGLRLSWARRKRAKEINDMAYRPEWWTKAADGRSLLAIALDVHMGVTGASDISPDDLKSSVFLLAHAVDMWRPSDLRFDAAVMEVCKAALAEYRNHPT